MGTGVVKGLCRVTEEEMVGKGQQSWPEMCQGKPIIPGTRQWEIPL